MSRSERRKQIKHVNKKLTTEQFQKLQSDRNREFIDQEVLKQTNHFKMLFTECLNESFKKNGISNLKAKMILEDVLIIMKRKVSEKRGES